MVTCPCCHGKKRLTVVEHDDETGHTMLTKPLCTHCEGKGEVEVEDEQQTWLPLAVPVADVLAQYSTPSLRKLELSRAEKKDHLLSLRMTPDEVEKLLAELYGATL